LLGHIFSERVIFEESRQLEAMKERLEAHLRRVDA
jgi:hypothetical protein